MKTMTASKHNQIEQDLEAQIDRKNPEFSRVFNKGIKVMKAAWEYNAELLRSQNLTIEDVSKHDKDLVVKKRKPIR